jgi:hypothetical protein
MASQQSRKGCSVRIPLLDFERPKKQGLAATLHLCEIHGVKAKGMDLDGIQPTAALKLLGIKF